MALQILSKSTPDTMNGVESIPVRINADGSSTRTQTTRTRTLGLTPAPPPPSDSFQGRDQLVDRIIADPEKTKKIAAPPPSPPPGSGSPGGAPQQTLNIRPGIQAGTRRRSFGRIKLVQLKTKRKNSLSWDF